MAPNAPWRIVDTTDPSDPTEYPSITHFLAGMKFKYASKLPDQAKVFSRGGTIHMSFLAQRQAEETTNTKGISKERDLKLTELETEAVKQEEISNLEKTGFDITKWAVVKDTLLHEAIKQRLQNDKWFCLIVNAAMTQNKYILYLDKYAKGGSELGGTYTITKTIQGENRYGVSIMTLAKENPTLLQNCLQKS
jgi:hypothetical protein